MTSAARPIRVAFLLQDFTTGGISQWIYSVCAELHRTDPGLFDFHFMCTHGWVIRQRFYEIGTPVFLGRVGKAPNWFDWQRVKRHLRRLNPDIAQFSNLERYRDICFAVRPPVIIERKAGVRTAGRYDSSGVDAVICQNRATMQMVERQGMRPPHYLVYPGVDIETLRRVKPDRLGFAADDIIIGQAARLGHGQRHTFMIDTVLELRRRHPQVKMVLVGGTTPQAGSVDLLPALREYARPLGEHVRFTGDQADPYPFIAGFNIATVTSAPGLGEGIPRRLVEPMTLGIPCVTTNCGATTEVVDDGVNGFVVDDSVDQMVDRIERLIVNPPLYRAFAKAARQKAEREFDIRVQAQKVKDIFLTLLEGNREHRAHGQRSH